MYVLTLKQPWAWMVVHGPKDIENRTWVDRRVAWLVQQRLPFLIHAAASETGDYYQEALTILRILDPKLTALPERSALTRGALIGTAKIAQIIEPREWNPDNEIRRRSGRLWHFEGQYGWMLTERRPLPSPVKCKGTLGLWKLPAKLLAELERKAASPAR